MTLKGNGGTENIEQLTADAIKASVLKTADDMRAAAKQAKETAVALETEAEQLAQALVHAGSSFADRVGGHLEKCKAASESFQTHRAALSKLPEIEGAQTKVISPSELKELKALDSRLLQEK